MKTHNIGIIMNGVTGRMGTNQHLMRSIVEIIKQGGIKVGKDEVIMPDPVLVGRNMSKLNHLKSISGVEKVSTDLDSLLGDPNYQIYFDSQTTGRRAPAVKQAIQAGKHIYCEKPVGVNTDEAIELISSLYRARVKEWGGPGQAVVARNAEG